MTNREVLVAVLRRLTRAAARMLAGDETHAPTMADWQELEAAAAQGREILGPDG